MASHYWFFAAILLIALNTPAAEFNFTPHTIATGLTGAYQVVIADVNGDGKPDLIALASGIPDLVWFENPGWQRHVIASGLNHMINAAALDIDHDGIPVIALAYNFSNDPAKSDGTVAILRHQGDPRGLWKLTVIDHLPTSHRLRWMKLDGSPVLINAPLAGGASKAPDYRDNVPLVLYRPPGFKREVIASHDQGIQHGLSIVPWKHEPNPVILTASFTGIHLHTYSHGKWREKLLSKANPASWPKSGASEIVLGHSREGEFLATIEPWHGNEVVVYRRKTREVIDDTLSDGHTLLALDLTNSGNDELIAGFRGPGHTVYIYSRDARNHWSRQTLDPASPPVAACAAADLDGDGKLDLACIGGDSLRWYKQN